jgi:hypothetical protein
MVATLYYVLAVIGSVITVAFIYRIVKKKNASNSTYAVLLVAETLVLPAASLNLNKEVTAENVVAFIVIMGVIIGSAVALAISKSEE